MAAINTNGSSIPLTVYSGTLPGVNPDSPVNSIAEKNSPDRPLWRERLFPKTDCAPFREAAAGNRRKSLQAAAECAVDQQKEFWVDDTGGSWRQVSATCRAVSQHACLFVDDAESLSVPQKTAQLYADEFDIMYGVVQRHIGGFADYDANGRVSILLYDIQDGGTTGGYLAGYFWNKDYLEQTPANHSNEADMLYLRGNPPGGWEAAESYYGDFFTFNLPTMAHEYAHMVSFSTMYLDENATDLPDLWIDEMTALAAETMYFKEKLRKSFFYRHPDMLPGGYLKSRIEYYCRDAAHVIRNGSGLTCWNYGQQVLANYSLAYLMGQYLAAHAWAGQGIFKDILTWIAKNGIYDYQAVAAVAARQIPGIASWDDLLKSWAAANLLNRPAGLAGYGNAFLLQAHGPTADSGHIQNSGVLYREVESIAAPADADSAPLLIYIFTDRGRAAPANRPSGGCAASYLLGGNHPGLAKLYAFRRVLAATGAGIELVALYYRHTAEAARLFAPRPELRRRGTAILNHLLQDISRKKPAISKAVISEGTELLQDLAACGSPQLQQAVGHILARFKSGSLPGSLGIETVQ